MGNLDKMVDVYVPADGEGHVLGGELVVGSSGEEQTKGMSLAPDITSNPSPMGVSGGQESGMMSTQAMLERIKIMNECGGK